MNPIPFPEQNHILAEDQPQYRNYPVYRSETGLVAGCWKGSAWDRIRFLFTGKMWLTQLTFNTPLQPVKLNTKTPFEGKS